MRSSTPFALIAVVWIGSVLGCGGGTAAGAAASPQIAGKWLGIIKAPGVELRIAFEIAAAPGGGYTALVHSIDQGAMNIPMTTVTFQDATLRLELQSAFAYEGQLQPDGNHDRGQLDPGRFHAARDEAGR